MLNQKSMRGLLHKAFSCFMSVVLVVGLSVPGSLVAYADDFAPAAPAAGSQFAASADSLQPAATADGLQPAATTDGLQPAADGVSPQSGECNYAVFNADTGTLTFMYGVPDSIAAAAYYTGYDTATYTKHNERPWSSVANDITKVVFDKSVEGRLRPVSTAYWFMYCHHCTAIEGLQYLDTSQVTTMAHMFDNFGRAASSPMRELDLSNFDTRNVTNMESMFKGTWGFHHIRFGEGFKTSKVTNMKSMFNYCTQLKSLDLSGFDTRNVTTMSSMFEECQTLESLDVSSFDTSNVTDMSEMFFLCIKLKGITWDDSFNTSKVTNMSTMFAGCWELLSITFPKTFKTGNVTDMSRMFDGCKALTTLDVSKFDTSKVTTFRQMFQNCKELTSLNVSNFSTAAATAIDYMFCGCEKPSTVTFGAGFTVEEVTNMDGVFLNCSALTTLDLSGWKASKTRSMYGAFYGCSRLATLNLSSFDTSSVNRFDQMFKDCSALSSITLGEKFSCKGNGITYANYQCKLPTPPTDSSYNGLWRKVENNTSYTPEGIQDLTGEDIAGTWTWSDGIAVFVTAGEGGTAVASPSNTGHQGDTVKITATPAENREFTSFMLTSGDDTGSISAAVVDPNTKVATAFFTFGASNGTVLATFKDPRLQYSYTVGGLSQASFTYNGQVQVPTFTVRDAATGQVLTEGVDYTVSYKKAGASVANPTDTGDYTVYVTGAANYGLVTEQSVGTFTIVPAYGVDVTVSCVNGWTPKGTSLTNWGSLQVMRPVGEQGEFEVVSTEWVPYDKVTDASAASKTVPLAYVAPGSKIVFTPQPASGCGAVSGMVPANTTAATSISLTAQRMNGIVEFSSLSLVRANRQTDLMTGGAYTLDDDPLTRTTPFALNKNSTRVSAVNADGREVPVHVIDGKSLVIKDDPKKLIAGARYTLTLSVYDPLSGGGGYFGGDNPYAAVETVEVTLANKDGVVCASDVNVTAYSRGRAAVHYSNPNGVYASLFLYDGAGKLVGEATNSGKGAGVITTAFLDAGNYTLCVVERDVYGGHVKTEDGQTAKAPDTLAQLDAFGFTSAQLVKQAFTIRDNEIVDIGVGNPLVFPSTIPDEIVDRDNSSVTAASSYSNYTTITVKVALLDVGADVLSRFDWQYHPKVRIYTNQKQPGNMGGRSSWPQSLSINGKPVAALNVASSMHFAMHDGWIDLDLYELYSDYQGAESFPLTVTMTVPRVDFTRTQASAYLQLPGRSNFIGSFDETAEDISLVVPEVTAEKTFTAQGYTAPRADVDFYLDGVPAASTTADEYGYYAAVLAFPDGVENSAVFDVQAVAGWTDGESIAHSAASEVLDVTYSTTRPSLKRLWMLEQYGQRGAWRFMLVYDNGEWSSMYKRYVMRGAMERRYVWIAEFNNAEYATNVECHVPLNERERVMPMTSDVEVADSWLSLSNPGEEWYVAPDELGTQSAELGTQSLVGDKGLIELGKSGTLSCAVGASVIKGYLEGDNAFVSEPVELGVAPSGVYVTFDEVERQTLARSGAYTGFKNLGDEGKANMTAFVTALNQSSHMRIVKQELASNGDLQMVDAATAAQAYINADSGQVDDWIAVAFDKDADGNALADPVWLQLHHTVATTNVDMSEPQGMITAAQTKYQEYLQNIRDAIAAGRSADDAVTLCPCKTDSTYLAGIPIKEMIVASDDEPDSMRYFIWAEDSNANCYVRSMEKFEVAGGGTAYRQYEADEKKLVITEWNGQTGQKTVITYELAPSFVSALTDGQHDTDFEFLMSMWTFVGSQVQLGLEDALDELAKNQENLVGQSAPDAQGPGALVAQGSGELVAQANNGIKSANGLVAWNDPAGGTSQRSWFDKLVHWREQALEDAGLVTDWGTLSDSELQSLFKFIWENKTDCLELAAKMEQSDNDEFVNPYGAAKAAAFRGGLKRVYDTVHTATDLGQKFYKEGVRKVVESQVDSYLKAKSDEAYRKFVYAQKSSGWVDDVLSKYSDEYIQLVHQLVYFEKWMYRDGNKQGHEPNCINWDGIPDDLIYALRNAEDNKDIYGLPERLKRLQSTASTHPKASYDPSGIVYEGMLSNPVEGATVKLYEYSSVAGDPTDDYAVFVDSEKFGYEPNPQVTGEDGSYQWFVGEGWWQVRVTKDGYTTQDGSKPIVSTGDSADFGIGATKTLTFDANGNPMTIEELIDPTKTRNASTYWMPVLPEQVDVNIPLYSTAAPVVESAAGTESGVLVTFSKPMKVDTVLASMFTVQMDGGAAQAVTVVVAQDEDVSVYDPNTKLARTFLVKYPEGISVTRNQECTATVAFTNVAGEGAAVSYAGTAAADGSKTSTFTIANELSVQDVSKTFTYNGQVQVPDVAVTDANDSTKMLTADDYTVTYKQNGEAVASPTDAGAYQVYVTGKGAYESMGEISAGSFTIAKRFATVKAADQSVFLNQEVSQDVSKATLTGAASGHTLGAIWLSADTSTATTSGVVSLASARVVDASGANVTSNYDLTYAPGKLTVTDQYTVRYNLNGGSGIAAAQNTDATGKVTLNNGKALSRVGYSFTGWNTAANGRGASYKAGGTYTFAGDVTLYAQWSPSRIFMHRLYNPHSGEHLYTASTAERDTLTPLGWRYEGLGWYAPSTSNTPVYRLYNPYSGDHHYTMDRAEYNWLATMGWRQEGVGWYSDDAKGVPLYRQFNPYETIGTHNYTTSKEENDFLVSIGWRAEGFSWYGMK